MVFCSMLPVFCTFTFPASFELFICFSHAQVFIHIGSCPKKDLNNKKNLMMNRHTKNISGHNTLCMSILLNFIPVFTNMFLLN